MLPSRMNPIIAKKLFIGSAVAISTATFFSWPWKANKIVYPPDNPTKKNRIFIPIRNEDELHELTLLQEPLLLNFTVRGDPACNKLTGSLYRLLSFDLDESFNVNLVDIETDELGTKELLLRYQVNKIPTVVCLEKQLPKGKYIEENLGEKEEVNWEKLKAWVESMADKK